MTTRSRTVDVAAPIDVAWAIASDLTRMPEWDPPIRSVTRLTGDGGVGSNYQVDAGWWRARLVLVAEVVELAPPRLLVSVVRHRLLDQRTTWQLEPTATGTSLTLITEHEFKKWLRPLGWPPPAVTARAERRVLDDLVALIESTTPGRQ